MTFVVDSYESLTRGEVRDDTLHGPTAFRGCASTITRVSVGN